MTDLHALTDAFAELERRADAASAAMPLELPPRRAPRPRPSWLVPVAATVAAVAGLAAGAALLAGGNPGTQAGAPPSAGGSTIPPSASTPAPASAVPSTPEELAARFRVVLGDMATFTVTDTGAGAVVLTVPASTPATPGAQPVPQPMSTTVGAAIVGTLTASGVTGGFDLGVYPTNPGDQASCNGADPSCTVRRLADGSSLAVSRVSLEGSPNGVTYAVDLVRPDGVEFDMHVSNQRSPKGASQELAAHPPLTTDHMIAILTSDRW